MLWGLKHLSARVVNSVPCFSMPTCIPTAQGMTSSPCLEVPPSAPREPTAATQPCDVQSSWRHAEPGSELCPTSRCLAKTAAEVGKEEEISTAQRESVPVPSHKGATETDVKRGQAPGRAPQALAEGAALRNTHGQTRTGLMHAPTLLLSNHLL